MIDARDVAAAIAPDPGAERSLAGVDVLVALVFRRADADMGAAVADEVAAEGAPDLAAERALGLVAFRVGAADLLRGAALVAFAEQDVRLVLAAPIVAHEVVGLALAQERRIGPGGVLDWSSSVVPAPVLGLVVLD